MVGGDLILVKAREAKMAPFHGEKGPIKRQGHFLTPTARFCHETQSPALGLSKSCTSSPEVRPTDCCFPTSGWAQWVSRMDTAHGEEWDAAGIRTAVKASTCRILTRPELIRALVDFWSPETNTFVFPWGEATVSLEDVAVLGGLPLLGEPAKMMGPMGQKLAAMNKRLIGELKRLSKPISYHWLAQFMGAKKGSAEGELEHVAFLSLWLSRFVFPGLVETDVRRRVFPVAIRLAWGRRIALAPAMLAGLYRDLRLLKAPSVSCIEGEATDSTVSSRFQLLQLWAWERFVSLRPEAGPRRSYSGRPMATRWHNLANKNLDSTFVSSVLRSEDEFQWRPYATISHKKGQPCFYRDENKWVHGDSEEDEELVAFSRCLAPCELVHFDCIEQYLPHRIAMQFGLDQDLPGSLPRVHHSWEQAWATYDKPIDRIKFYVPPRMSMSGCTLQYQLWWDKYVSPCSAAMINVVHGSKSCPLTADTNSEMSCQIVESMPCTQEKLPIKQRKRKRYRPEKGKQVLAEKIRKPKRSRSSRRVPSGATSWIEHGAPEFSAKYTDLPEGISGSCCQYIKEISQIKVELHDEYLPVALQVKVEDAKVSYNVQDSCALPQIKLVYR